MSAKAPTRAPDQAHYVKTLGRLGWYFDRDVKHGKLYRSPNGKHTFVLSKSVERCDWRGVKNDIARLRREGGEALALANELTGREYDIHLPKINPTQPPPPLVGADASYLAAEHELLTDLGGLDTAQLNRLSPVVVGAAKAERAYVQSQVKRLEQRREEAVAKAAEEAAAPPEKRQLSEHALRRAAVEVINIIVNRFDGELTMAKVSTRRAVTTALIEYSTYSSRHIAVGVSYGEQQGWLDSYWPNGVGSRTGRTRITVTPAGYREVGLTPPDPIVARDPEPEAEPEPQPSDRERELLELLELAEAERDDAKREAKEAREELEALARTVEDNEKRWAEAKTDQPWNDRVLGAAVLVLREADGCPANSALVQAAIAVLGKVAG